MGFWIEREEELEDAIRRIALEQIGAAIEDIDASDPDDHGTVHEVRKRCKKIRGLIRLARPALGHTYTAENAWFRNTARQLSDLRDATTLIEALDALVDGHQDRLDSGAFVDVRSIRGGLWRRRDEIAAVLDIDDRLEDCRTTMVEAQRRAGSWSLDEPGCAAISDGLVKTYGRARKAMKRVSDDPTAARVHEWRKRVKYHHYHCRLLHRLCPPELETRENDTKRLSDLLGDHRDLTIFKETLIAEPERFGGAQGLRDLIPVIDRCRTELRTRSLSLGPKLFAEKPDDLAKRLEPTWHEWRGAGFSDDGQNERSTAVGS